MVPTVWTGNVRLCVDIENAGGPGAIPDPDNCTICGLPAAVSVRVRDPKLGPKAEGVNETLMEQLDRGAIPPEQSFVCKKAEPARTRLLTVTVTFEGLVNVSVRGGLVVPIT